MNALTKELLRAALLLDPVEKAQHIEQLFESFDTTPDQKIKLRWAKEVESRLDAYSAGQISADSIEVVMERINQR